MTHLAERMQAQRMADCIKGRWIPQPLLGARVSAPVLLEEAGEDVLRVAEIVGIHVRRHLRTSVQVARTKRRSQ